jgi:hypothetical protein
MDIARHVGFDELSFVHMAIVLLFHFIHWTNILIIKHNHNQCQR